MAVQTSDSVIRGDKFSLFLNFNFHLFLRDRRLNVTTNMCHVIFKTMNVNTEFLTLFTHQQMHFLLNLEKFKFTYT